LLVAFRTDASIEIGTGHVMRCLTLATELRARGAECVFLSRPHTGHLFDLIANQGFTVLALGGSGNGIGMRANGSADAKRPIHADWLGVDWEVDAAETLSALVRQFPSCRVDWLVVDHYGIDARWERTLRSACQRLLVIDDLADRPHDCDLLLDQSLGRVAADYAGLVPDKAMALIGPSYALLRPEFAKLRSESLARRVEPRLEHLLVTLGGVDKDNVTTRVLDAIDASALPETVRITVVMGPHAPWIEAVRSRAGRMRQPTEVLVGVRDMARLMAESDLAIGAGGTTTWERCTLGLPTLTVVVAQNQQEVASRLASTGATISVPECSARDMLPGVLAAITQAELGRLSRASRTICDGTGTSLVGQELRRSMQDAS
jgi:UDP-2,4-diacetamido-2,4,6-trideoxy-beta-L-altropyranose hydrolase